MIAGLIGGGVKRLDKNMSVNSRFTAAEYAKRALEIAWDGNLPVNPAAVARGLVVHKTTPNGERVDVPIRVQAANPFNGNGYSGQATLVNEQGAEYYLCEYNPHEYDYRIRFTIAHELGHVLLAHVHEGNRMLRDGRDLAFWDL